MTRPDPRRNRQRTRPAVRVEATTVARHIAALVDAGWTRRQIALMTDVGTTTVYRLAAGQTRVHPATAALILALDPDTGLTSRTTGSSRADYDEVLVHRVLAGDVTRTVAQQATVVERREVVRRWRNQGRSLKQLGELTGWKPERYLEQDNEAVA